MIINHHFRVEIKAHNFNLSSVNKRFLPPVISISPVTFLSPTGLGQSLPPLLPPSLPLADAVTVAVAAPHCIRRFLSLPPLLTLTAPIAAAVASPCCPSAVADAVTAPRCCPHRCRCRCPSLLLVAVAIAAAIAAHCCHRRCPAMLSLLAPFCW